MAPQGDGGIVKVHFPAVFKQSNKLPFHAFILLFRTSAAAVFSWGATGGLLEDRGEIVFATEAAEGCDGFIRLVGLCEQSASALDTKLFYVLAYGRSCIAVEELIYRNS